MTTYQFKCNKCDEKFELAIAWLDLQTTLVYCPKCHSSDVKKVWSILPIIFKGKGFYSTDKKDNK